MSRAFCIGLFLAFSVGCATTGERAPLRPLQEDGPPIPYAELLTRARQQAQTANEAFFVNKWADLEDAARGLEHTARFLGGKKVSDVPPQLKDTLPAISIDLGKEATKLKEAAKANQVNEVNGVLQRVNLKLRELCLDG